MALSNGDAQDYSMAMHRTVNGDAPYYTGGFMVLAIYMNEIILTSRKKADILDTKAYL